MLDGISPLWLFVYSTPRYHATIHSPVTQAKTGSLEQSPCEERIAIESGTPTERRGGGDSISQVNIQRKTIQKAFEFYGNSLWHFGHNSGRRMNKAREIIAAVQETCKYEVSLDQLRRWVHVYLQYGNVPAKVKIRNMTNKNAGRNIFTTEDSK